MALLLVLVMLTACAATPEDMSGKMFTFPLQGNKAHVKLSASPSTLVSFTVCHRSFTDLKRDHALFSFATPTHVNDILIFWDQANKEIRPHIRDKRAEYGGQDYKGNTWHSICTSWDSESGIVQLWFDGLPFVRKFISAGSPITGNSIIILGQEQDSHGGGFDIGQSFVGMMTDVHMWDYKLSSCEIQYYMDEMNFTPGNVINWRALNYKIVDKVLVDNKLATCH